VRLKIWLTFQHVAKFGGFLLGDFPLQSTATKHNIQHLRTIRSFKLYSPIACSEDIRR